MAAAVPIASIVCPRKVPLVSQRGARTEMVAVRPPAARMQNFVLSSSTEIRVSGRGFNATVARAHPAPYSRRRREWRAWDGNEEKRRDACTRARSSPSPSNGNVGRDDGNFDEAPEDAIDEGAGGPVQQVIAAGKRYFVPLSFGLIFLKTWLMLSTGGTDIDLRTVLELATSFQVALSAGALALDGAAAAMLSALGHSAPVQLVEIVLTTLSKMVVAVNKSVVLQTVVFSWLAFTRAPLMKTSRTATHALSRAIAAGNLMPSWVSAAVAKSGPYVGRALRCISGWALVNNLVRQIPAETAFTIPKLLRVFLSKADNNSDNILEAFEIHQCVMTYSLRFLAAGLCWLWARWFMVAKTPPPWTMRHGNTKEEEEAGGKGDAVERHFAALRRDEGVSWERQARATLIDSALTLGCNVIAVFSVLNALDVDITGLLAVGGVGGVAVSFGAQRVMGNLLSGLLLFVTQPFKAGDVIKAVDGYGYYEGEVEFVGWHSTVLKDMSKDGGTVIVPNSDLSTMTVRNLSRGGPKKKSDT